MNNVLLNKSIKQIQLVDFCPKIQTLTRHSWIHYKAYWIVK